MRKSPEVTKDRFKAWASLNIMKVIRSFCFECMGGHRGYINECTSRTCPLWPFREGDTIKSGFAQAEELVNQEPVFREILRRQREKTANRIQKLRKRADDDGK
jgi:hypothetical protein